MKRRGDSSDCRGRPVGSVEAGERIGGFRVLEALHGGVGAQGTVCRAVCEQPPFPGIEPGEVVALKTMSVADEDGSLFRTLQRQTDILVALGHPNVVRYRGCFALGDAFSALHVVVMEFLEGETLKDRLAAHAGGLDVDEALDIANKVVAGCEAVTAAGLVHRDIKPGNVFLGRDGSVKLIDFELARGASAPSPASGGRFLGTFDYMAPEFANATFVGDERSDIFSLGVVIHEMLCGRTPYVQEKDAQKGVEGERPADFAFLERWAGGALARSALSISVRSYRLLAGMRETLRRALEPDRAKRFPSFSTLRAALAGVRLREFHNGERHYRLLHQVGKGGFGEVFKARMAPGGQVVAVKHLLKATYGDRFRREADVMQRFRDDCFTQFVDYFEANRAGVVSSYLVMAYLPNMPGSSLRDAIRRAVPGHLAPKEVIAAFIRYAHGLSVLHRGEVIHRDIKPSNLYYPPEHPEQAVIMDMGIVRDAAGSVSVGHVPGTLDYMPPEIVTDGSRGDARMDIYALGLCFYEALTGHPGFPRLPSGADGLRAFYARARAHEQPAFDDPDIQTRPSVLGLLRHMTTPDHARRLGDAAELERRLRAIQWEATACPPATPAVLAVPGLAPSAETGAGTPPVRRGKTDKTAIGRSKTLKSAGVGTAAGRRGRGISRPASTGGVRPPADGDAETGETRMLPSGDLELLLAEGRQEDVGSGDGSVFWISCAAAALAILAVVLLAFATAVQRLP